MLTYGDASRRSTETSWKDGIDSDHDGPVWCSDRKKMIVRSALSKSHSHSYPNRHLTQHRLSGWVYVDSYQADQNITCMTNMPTITTNHHIHDQDHDGKLIKHIHDHNHHEHHHYDCHQYLQHDRIVTAHKLVMQKAWRVCVCVCVCVCECVCVRVCACVCVFVCIIA